MKSVVVPILVGASTFLVTILVNEITGRQSDNVDVDLGIALSELTWLDRVMWATPLAMVVAVAVFVIALVICHLVSKRKALDPKQQ